jgi:hypothetical protein
MKKKTIMLKRRTQSFVFEHRGKSGVHLIFISSGESDACSIFFFLKEHENLL